jgi:uncharacterized membrane protein YgdD (TMEM256/DUF423 family)
LPKDLETFHEKGRIMRRFWLVIAAVSGFASVALGALGAHALKDTFDEYGKSIYETAVLYQMFHSSALLAVGILQNLFKKTSLAPAGWLFFAGIILFSGSLYLLAVTGARWLAAITPLGGVSFLLGWAWLVFAFVKVSAGDSD